MVKKKKILPCINTNTCGEYTAGQAASWTSLIFTPSSAAAGADFTHNTSHIKCVGFFSTDNQFSRTPAPTGWVSHSSAQLWHKLLKLTSDATSLRALSHKTAGCKYWEPRVPTLSDTATKLRVLTPSHFRLQLVTRVGCFEPTCLIISLYHLPNWGPNEAPPLRKKWTQWWQEYPNASENIGGVTLPLSKGNPWVTMTIYPYVVACCGGPDGSHTVWINGEGVTSITRRESKTLPQLKTRPSCLPAPKHCTWS